MFVFLLALWCFVLCFVVLITSCLCVEHAYILMLLCFIECMFGWSFAFLCDHCSHFYITVLVYDQLLTCFTSCLLERNLLVTLYLSFYYLLYLKDLMCFVQVFQITCIYVSSASQEEKCAHWKGKCLYLYPCLCSFWDLYHVVFVSF